MHFIVFFAQLLISFKTDYIFVINNNTDLLFIYRNKFLYIDICHNVYIVWKGFAFLIHLLFRFLFIHNFSIECERKPNKLNILWNFLNFLWKHSTIMPFQCLYIPGMPVLIRLWNILITQIEGKNIFILDYNSWCEGIVV